MKALSNTVRTLLVLMLVIWLTGCAEIQKIEGNVQGDLQKVQGFAATDIQAALDDATAKNDVAASNCYRTLLEVVKGANITAPQIKGAVSAFQAGRDVIGNSGISTLSKQINIGCAALFVDASVTIGKIAAMAGVGVPALPLPLSVPLP